MPDLPLLPWMDKTLHPFWWEIIKNPQIQDPSKFWETKLMLPKKSKDRNDHIGKIYRFQWSLYIFWCKKTENWWICKKMGVPSCILISDSDVDDGGDAGEHLTEAEEEAKFRSLRDAVSRKQAKVGMSRWFGYITSMNPFLRIWTRRLVLCLYCSLSMGLFTKGRASLGLKLTVRNEDLL